MFETPTTLVPVFVNHAHNDWLEVWLEGGWPALAILAAFLIWFASVAVRRWRTYWPNEAVLDRSLSRAGTIVVPLLMLHSAVDYPLRTTALKCLAAFCCALVIPPASDGHDEARHADKTRLY
jgi:O-antigen ligase